MGGQFRWVIYGSWIVPLREIFGKIIVNNIFWNLSFDEEIIFDKRSIDL